MKFFSLKYSDLILTVDPKTFTVESGFRVTKGMMGLYPQGLSLNFKNGEFDTKSLNLNFGEKTKLIKILKRHPSYGRSFLAEDHDKNADGEVGKEDEEVQKIKKKAADTNHQELVNKKK
jgi:hypothetical protein